jgi:hypothetical protein
MTRLLAGDLICFANNFDHAPTNLFAGLIASQPDCCCSKCTLNCFMNGVRSPLSMAQKIAISNPSNIRAAAIASILNFRANQTMTIELSKIPAMEKVERQRLKSRRAATIVILSLKSLKTGIDRFVLAIIAKIVFKEMLSQQQAV